MLTTSSYLLPFPPTNSLLSSTSNSKIRFFPPVSHVLSIPELLHGLRAQNTIRLGFWPNSILYWKKNNFRCVLFAYDSDYHPLTRTKIFLRKTFKLTLNWSVQRNFINTFPGQCYCYEKLQLSNTNKIIPFYVTCSCIKYLCNLRVLESMENIKFC